LAKPKLNPHDFGQIRQVFASCLDFRLRMPFGRRGFARLFFDHPLFSGRSGASLHGQFHRPRASGSQAQPKRWKTRRTPVEHVETTSRQAWAMPTAPADRRIWFQGTENNLGVPAGCPQRSSIVIHSDYLSIAAALNAFYITINDFVHWYGVMPRDLGLIFFHGILNESG
jgi:hypothetical protein